MLLENFWFHDVQIWHMKNVAIKPCKDMYDYQIAMYLSITCSAQLSTSFGVSDFD